MSTGEATAQRAPPAEREREEFSAQTGSNEVLAEQVRLLPDNAPLSQLVALINSGILAFVQWSQVQHIAVAVWLLCIGAVSLARWSQAYAFRRARPADWSIGR